MAPAMQGHSIWHKIYQIFNSVACTNILLIIRMRQKYWKKILDEEYGEKIPSIFSENNKYKQTKVEIVELVGVNPCQ